MIVHLLSQAGFLGVLLVICSIVSLGVVFERILFWRRLGRTLNTDEKQRWIITFKNGASQEMPICKNVKSQALTYLVDNKNADSEKVFNVALSRVVGKTNQYLAILDTTAAIAPMLGILGTVLGIIQSFAGMKGDAPDTTLMISGISTAMSTTAIGLMVSLFSLVAFNVFSTKAHKCQVETAELLQEVYVSGNS